MLATLGFIITAILLILFAYTFDSLVKKDDKELRLFGLAYLLVAVAFLMWGLLSFSNASSTLPHSVLVGDALLFAASTCSALVFTPRKWRGLIAVGAVVVTIILLCVRAKYYYPVPSLHDGVLFFNTQRQVAVLLSTIVVVAWLPACMKVARIVTTKHGLQRYYSLYVSAYALTIITAALFIQARRRSVVIESFIGFAVSILLLLLSNVLAMNSHSHTVKVNNGTE
jgi:hypothetical protein